MLPLTIKVTYTGGKRMKQLSIQGANVPALGFGTWDLRGDECTESIEHALSIGYRHIDTAQYYDNETEVGKGIQNSGMLRDDIFLTTKVKPENFRRSDVISSTHESLKKLGTDYVDLLLMHWPNPDIPLEETLLALLELQKEGAVRHIGVSNFPPTMVEEAQQISQIFCNQVEYHPYLSQPKLIAQAQVLDYMLTAYCPIAQGRVINDTTLKNIGEHHNKSAVQVTLRWFMQQENVSAIPKSASTKNRQSNFDIFDFELSDEEMQTIHNLNQEQRLVNPDDGPAWER